MNRYRLAPKLFALLLLLAVMTVGPGPAIAGDDVVTFEAFYRAPHAISWGWPAIAALVVGVVIYVGFFPVTGPVTAIGTSLGGLMGLSGAAATNAGLALLGGGAMVSGGLGVLGGAALLSAAISFSTDIILDYATGNVLERYEYRQAAENSWRMMTLPLPRNTSGPGSVEAAGRALKNDTVQSALSCFKEGQRSDVDTFKACLTSKEKPQRELVRNALAELDRYRDAPEVTLEAAARKYTMYATLQLLNNDYLAAKWSADVAYGYALKASQRATLPAFIISASMLYEDRPDFAKSFEFFRYAITAEPNNPLTPVLFSAYLDRLAYRLNDRAASLNDMDRLDTFAQTLADDERKIAIQQVLLSHQFMHLKIAQQRIISFTGTENQKVRDNPQTLEIAKSSLNDYTRLLNTSKGLLDRQVSVLGVLARQSTSWWDDVARGVNPFSEKVNLDKRQGWSESLWTFAKAWAEYQRGLQPLTDRITQFENQLKAIQLEKEQQALQLEKEKRSIWGWIMSIF